MPDCSGGLPATALFHEVIVDRNDLMVILQRHDQTSTQQSDSHFLTIRLTS